MELLKSWGPLDQMEVLKNGDLLDPMEVLVSHLQLSDPL